MLTVQSPSLDGILLVDKKINITSHDVVNFLRRKFNLPKVGHSGTLDPFASGILIMLIGRATKLSSHFIGLDKSYEGTIHLGIETDTQDSQGQHLQTLPIPPNLSHNSIQSLFDSFLGDQLQTPPMFSAKKFNGKPLYKLARKGHSIEREPTPIRIHSFSLTHFAPPLLSFSLSCSKGTYVRTIAHDVGQKLACGAHLSQLRRTAIHSFNAQNATPFDDLNSLSFSQLKSLVIPIQDAINALPTYSRI